MPYELPPDPSAARRARITSWVSFAFAAVLVALLAYFGYVGFEGSRQLTAHPGPSTDCRTPAVLGWSYEPINYDAADDVDACSATDSAAGDLLTGAGDVGLAGWYIPSADGAGPSAPTVVLAHGWGSNKSAMLERAAVLHDAYNLVLFDFRNHGQSGTAPTTQGIRESGDLLAVLDWLESTKGPDQVAVLGVSMGGASAAYAAARDERIDALILESTHATLANAAQARLDTAGYPLALPGSWAILLGSLVRTGEDVSGADPLQAMDHLDGRPVLIITGSDDGSIGPTDATELAAAAESAGSPTELRVCEAAGHARSPEVCGEDYAAWVLGFLERVIGPQT